MDSSTTRRRGGRGERERREGKEGEGGQLFLSSSPDLIDSSIGKKKLTGNSIDDKNVLESLVESRTVSTRRGEEGERSEGGELFENKGGDF